MLVGNLVAILFSALVTTVISLIWPDNYTWDGTRQIAMVDDQDTGKKTYCSAPACKTRPYVVGRVTSSSCMVVLVSR